MSEPVININLNLTLGEVNLILTSLGKQPYENVAATLQKVRSQAIPQLQVEANSSAEESASSEEVVSSDAAATASSEEVSSEEADSAVSA